MTALWGRKGGVSSSQINLIITSTAPASVPGHLPFEPMKPLGGSQGTSMHLTWHAEQADAARNRCCKTRRPNHTLTEKLLRGAINSVCLQNHREQDVLGYSAPQHDLLAVLMSGKVIEKPNCRIHAHDKRNRGRNPSSFRGSRLIFPIL